MEITARKNCPKRHESSFLVSFSLESGREVDDRDQQNENHKIAENFGWIWPLYQKGNASLVG